MTTPSPARVLIIDDDSIIRLTMTRLLRRHDVDVAATGAEAVSRCMSDAPFDVIFCDLMMPDMNGMQVYEHVRSHAPELAERFVFMTGGAFTEEAVAFVSELDEGRVMHKPLEIGRVKAFIEHARHLRAT